MPPGGAADDAKGGCFLGAIGKEQEREGREAAGLHISRLWLGLMGCSRQTLLLPVLLVLADCRAQSSSTSTDWHGLTLYKGRVTELLVFPDVCAHEHGQDRRPPSAGKPG